MRIRISIFLLIIAAGILFAFLFSVRDIFTEQNTEWTKIYQATKEAERELTRSYGIEIRSAIELYHIRAGTFGFYRNPDELSIVVTEPYLDRLLSTEGYTTKEYLTATRQISISDVRVLDYTPTRFIAISCGVLYEDKITLEGKYIESLPPQKFENIYVFIRVNERWKLLVAYDFRDPQSIIRDLEHAIGWEKEYSGDLIDYFPRDYGCSVR
jgi:hypothetical protein